MRLELPPVGPGHPKRSKNTPYSPPCVWQHTPTSKFSTCLGTQKYGVFLKALGSLNIFCESWTPPSLLVRKLWAKKDPKTPKQRFLGTLQHRNFRHVLEPKDMVFFEQSSVP